MEKYTAENCLKVIYPSIITKVSNFMQNPDSREEHKNDNWGKRYNDYLSILSLSNDKSRRIKRLQSAIHIETPLTKYLSVSCVKETNEKKVVYDIRVYGHSIGHLIIPLNSEINKILNKDIVSQDDRRELNELVKKAKNRKFRISETNYNALKKLMCYFPDPDNNDLKVWCDKKDFTAVKTFSWTSKEMTELRSIFKNAKDILKIGSEHSCENLLLRRLAEKDGSKKYIKDIQPIKIAGCGFFQMPTCIGGSDTKSIKYSGEKGGGIDILAKIKKSGNKPSELCVIELKDEYKDSENPRIAMQQAIAYAVCLDYILRSSKDDTDSLNWYQVLTGSKRKISNTININVVVAMPYMDGIDSPQNISPEDKKLANKELTINVYGHEDKLILHYLFFKKEALKQDNIENGIITSLFKK